MTISPRVRINEVPTGKGLSMSRLDDLQELREHLRTLVLSEHSEHGLQGLSGLVGQYQKCLVDIAEIEAKAPKREGTVLDEFTQRRALKKPAARSSRAAVSK